eukprot:3924717-Amphidinium_carterae.1
MLKDCACTQASGCCHVRLEFQTANLWQETKGRPRALDATCTNILESVLRINFTATTGVILTHSARLA